MSSKEPKRNDGADTSGALNASLQETLMCLGPSSFVRHGMHEGREFRPTSKSDSEMTFSSNYGATGYPVEQLIERMTSENSCELEFTNVFLMLYRKFMTPLELLDALLERFDLYDSLVLSQAGDQTQRMSKLALHPVSVRVCNVLVLWMEQYIGDFSSEKIRFTMHVFLGVLNGRAGFTLICQNISELLFRHVPDHPHRQGWDWLASVEVEDEESFYAMMDAAEELSQSTEKSSLKTRSNRDVHRSSVGVWNGYEREIRRVGKAPLSHSDLTLSPVSPPTPEASVLPLSASHSSSSSVVSNSSSSAGSTPVSSSPVPRKTSLFASLFLPNSDAASSAYVDSSVAETVQNLLKMGPVFIAEQLCLLEFSVFKEIGPRDFLQHIWGKLHKGQHAPSVTASIAHFNFVSSWVTTCVLSQPKSKARSNVLQTFIKIAEQVRRLNNFNTLMAILAGLNSAAILRLKKTRKLLLGRRGQDVYSELERQMSSERSFSKYRYCLRRSEAPCVPYLGVFLRDLLYIEEANKDHRSDGLINLPKFLLIGDILMMIQSFQLRPYPFVLSENFKKTFFSIKILSEEDSYQRSLELEPKHSNSMSLSTSKIKRLM